VTRCAVMVANGIAACESCREAAVNKQEMKSDRRLHLNAACSRAVLLLAAAARLHTQAVVKRQFFEHLRQGLPALNAADAAPRGHVRLCAGDSVCVWESICVWGPAKRSRASIAVESRALWPTSRALLRV
jgi:hypothetical protein